MISEPSNSEKDNLRQKKISNKMIYKNEILKNIINIAKEYVVVDWTDNESCCYEFKILLHKNTDILDDDKKLMKYLEGERNDLRIFISVLEPYYYMFIEKTTYSEATDKWIFSIVKAYNKDYAELLKKINGFLSKNGYGKLFEIDVLMPVPNIETEYKEINKVNVFDCLFTDLVNIP